MNLKDAIRATELSEEKVYCEIDPETREISVPETYKIIGVASDEDVERVWFKCPKVVGDNIDLSKYQLRVNYQNANSDKGQYIITDVKIDGDNIIFSWLLGRLVTAYVGKISFIICAVNVSSSDIKNEWNTTLAQAQVLTGLEVDPQDLPTTGDDLINQLKSLTAQTQTFARTAQAASKSAQDNADKVQQQADRVEDILENVPDFNEYDTLAQLEKSFYEGRKYNGMTYAGKTSDKGVKLHSVKGKTVQQTTNGYQLFDASKLATKSQGGATVTNNGDGSFTISGSGTLTEDYNNTVNYDDIIPLLKEGNIFLKTENATTPAFQVLFLNESYREIGNINNLNSSSGSFNLDNEKIYNIKHIQIRFTKSSGSEIKTGTIKPMLYQDGDGTWEPYTGGKPAPNPDYPMEIENVEISKVFSSSGNMLNLNWDWEHNNVDYMITNDRTIKAFVTNKIGHPMISHVFSDNELEFIKGKYITPLYDKKESSKTTSIFQIYYKNPNGSYYISPSNGKQFIPKNITQFVVQLVIVNSDNLDGIEVGDYAKFTAPRIIVGDLDDTSWRPYGFNAIETSLTLAEGDTYENGQITRTRKQVVFDGSSDEAWAQNNCEIGYRYSIALTPIAIISDATNGQTSFNTSLPLGDHGATYGNKNCYTISTGNFATANLWISLNGTETLEEFKQYLQAHPMTLVYTLATPTTEEFKVPSIPSYYPYTNVSTDNDLTTEMTWKVLADCNNSLAQEALEKRIEALEQNALGE